MEDVVQVMSSIMRKQGISFTLEGQPIKYESVFADNGMLPPIAQRADQLCSLCLGYGLGITFEEDSEGTVKKRVQFDEATPKVLRYLCLTDVLCELSKRAPEASVTPLDELLYE